ncbi:MAG: DUF4265 domain-containing protein [Rhodobacterales bacterium]|nr:DUF4265 domain-containing protein [Rhodobacterales bacterium]
MRYSDGDYEAVHSSPVWQDRANFILAAHLGTKDGRNEWEQLWGEEVGPNRYVLCCIPFFAYDIALGDEVETDSNSTIEKVVRRSGQVTFRIWLGGTTPENCQNLVSEVEAAGALLECSSENLLALSVSERHAQKIANILQQHEESGHLQYETGVSVKR